MILRRAEVAEAIKDHDWQMFRLNLLGSTFHTKMIRLQEWVRTHDDKRSKIQVQNYLNALRRGGTDCPDLETLMEWEVVKWK